MPQKIQEQNSKEGFIDVTLDRNPGNSTFSEHTHTCHEIYFLISGRVKYFIKDEIFNANSGDVLMIKKNYIHTTSYPEGTASERILISYNDALLGSAYKALTKSCAERKHFVLSSERQKKVEKIVRRLYLEYKNKEEHYMDMCRNLLGELLIIINREDNFESGRELSGTPLVIQNAAKYISANIGENLSLGELSRRFAMSPSYFSKTFKQYTGLGVNEYITALRMARAKKLLKVAGHSITEVATKCGFNDSNYFATVFKRTYGISPKKYSKEE
ncbi:MAG: helix-turn-helix domain-containing protein [Clostridia bacterium]|nr:helix-turn-helix domain-containing protein [Clostridia bacterium]